MAYIEDLVQALDARIEALNAEIASLEEARSAMIASGGAAEAVPQPRNNSTLRRPSRRRHRVLGPEAAERILAEGDGLSAADVASYAGARRDQVLRVLRDLEAARRARRTGHGRGTRWHLMTDEDWILERAQELAGRRRGK
jgi:cell division septum initiation protein DivIVA